MNRWKVAIFDWNGTLLDDITLAYRSVIEIFKRYGLAAPPLQRYREEITADFIKFYRKYGVPPHITPQEINGIRQEVFLRNWGNVRLRRGALTLLRRLDQEGLQRAVVSAEVPEVLERRMKQFKLLPHLEYVRGGAWPKERAFREAIARFEIKPDQAFHVDDTFDGLVAAKSIGLTTIGYEKGYNSKERILAANPDFVINSITEILDIVKNGGAK